MNNQRRKKIEKLKERLEEIVVEIEELQEIEEDCLENLPDSLKESEKGEKMVDAIGYLEGSADYIRNAIEELESVIS
jgi:chromosome condensin MukBEF ATPase and DNA-binding subunit MukB